MNPYFQMWNGNVNPQNAPVGISGQMFQNPVQKMQYIMQAMTNPQAFVKNAFPDIPNGIQNDPNQILQYLQQSRGITNEQVQQVANQIPRRW